MRARLCARAGLRRDQPLAREVGACDLDQVSLVEERELEVAGRDEGPDRGRPQAAHPADPADGFEPLDLGGRQHPPVAGEDDIGEP